MQQDGRSLKQTQHPLIVSYFTPDTPYERHAMALREDARRLGLAARIEPLVSRGSWVENCAQKAGFILDMHKQEQRPLLWLDADARLRRKLHVLEDVAVDLAVARRHGWEFYTGQIYFGASAISRRLLDIWRDHCVRYPHIWDQVLLGYAWWELSLQERIKTMWLGNGVYHKVSRRPAVRLWQNLFSRTPIVQQQESRRSKAMQGVPEQPEFGMDDVPLWWRKAAAREAPFPLDAAQRRSLGLE